jgi:hypothetical protein
VLAFEVKGFLSCRNKACASYRILIIGTRVRHGAPHITNQKNAYGQNYVSTNLKAATAFAASGIVVHRMFGCFMVLVELEELPHSCAMLCFLHFKLVLTLCIPDVT